MKFSLKLGLSGLYERYVQFMALGISVTSMFCEKIFAYILTRL